MWEFWIVASAFAGIAFVAGRWSMRVQALQETESARLLALLAFIAARTQGAIPCYVEDMVEVLQRFRVIRDRDDLLDLVEQAELRQWIEIYKPTTPRETPFPIAYTMTNLGLIALRLARSDWLRRPTSDPVR